MARAMAPTPNSMVENTFPAAVDSEQDDHRQPYILLIDGPGAGPRVTAHQLTRMGCAVCHVAAEQASDFASNQYHAVVINGDLSDLHSSSFVRTLRHTDRTNGWRTPILAVPGAENYARRRYLTDIDVDEILGAAITPEEL